MIAPQGPDDRGRAPTLLRQAVVWGASLQAHRTSRRFRSQIDASDTQAKIWRRLIANFAQTAFGRDNRIESAMTYAAFQQRVPLRSYEQFAPWIDRMKRSEPDVLWPGRCAHFAVSSGTTLGRTKYIPVTRAMLGHFRQTGLDSLFLYASRTGHAQVFAGRHLFLGGSTSLAPIADSGPEPAWAGDLSGITALNLPRWAERHLYEPGRDIAQIADWPSKIAAMAARTERRDIRLVAGIPSWILVFAEAMRERTGAATLREVWPKLECLVHGGVPIGPFQHELQQALGEEVRFHEVYPASEAFIAAQETEPAAGMRLFTDAGVFYEFLPLAEFDETRLAELGARAIPVAEVQTNTDYVILLTTPGGLCRYVIGDVVRFTSTRPPRLIYVGRTRLQLSAFGEHVIEKEVTDAIATVCRQHGLLLSNFHVAPKFIASDAGERRGRHEWWIELKSFNTAAVVAATVAAAIDRELQQLNEDYEAKRIGGGMEVPLVHLVGAGTFETWLRMRGKWGGQNKMPRCRSDREIADQLDAVVAAQSHI